MDNAHNGLVASYQCNIDGKFTITLDEFLCAIQRIDQPEYGPAGPFRDINLC